MKRRRNGFFLVQAVVLTLLLAVLATTVLKIGFSRSLTARSRGHLNAARRAALAARDAAFLCLEATGYGASDCGLTAPQRACLPTKQDDYDVTFSAAGSPGECRLTVRAKR